MWHSWIIYFIGLFCFPEFASSEDLFHGNQTAKVLSNDTICGFPSFLQIALGVSCQSKKPVKNDEHLWFAPVAQPVGVVRDRNETCERGRFAWDSANSSLCCLELPCPHGQVLAKDSRNTADGDCPKCRNVIFEYICDPLNDTCNSLHIGSKCRKFFNSSDLFICACDAANGYTQNRLAFPAACTKTIGAVCFLKEHCKFVDPNTRCDFKNDTRPPRGTCQCKSGSSENSDGRCVEKIRQVRQTALADWGDKNIWADGPLVKYPNYDITPSESQPKSASPVLEQAVDKDSFNDGNADTDQVGYIARRMIRALNNSAPAKTDSIAVSTSTQASIPKPQPYMINAQHMVPNVSSTSQIKVIGGKLVTLPDGSTADANKVTSSNAISGTKFATDDRDTQLDSVLNIVRPVKRKLQTDRPTTSKTYDVTPSAGSTEKIPYWKKNANDSTVSSSAAPPSTQATLPQTSATIVPKVVMQSLSTSKEIVASSAPSKELPTTHASAVNHESSKVSLIPLEGFLAGSALIDGIYSRESTPSSGTTSQSSTTTSTTPPTTVETTPTSTTTTTQTSTLKPATTQTSTLKPATTTQTSTLKPATTKAKMETAVSQSGSEASDDTIMVDNADGVIRVQLNGDTSRRFGGVVRVPSHSVIGGVSRPVQSQGVISNLDASRTEIVHHIPLTTSTTQTPLPPTDGPSPTAPPPPPATTTPEVIVYEHHGVDLSFLQDQTISKAEMQKKLLQALLELSATTTTTTPTTTTTTPTTTTKAPIDLSFLSDGNLSAADIQIKLLPLLMQLNSQLTSPSPVTTTTVQTTTMRTTTEPVPKTTKASGVPPDIAAALAQLRQLQAAEKKTTQAPSKRKVVWTTQATTTAPVPIPTTDGTELDEPYSGPSTTARPKKQRQMSFFSALWSGLGTLTPHQRRRNQTDPEGDENLIEVAIKTTTTTAPSTTARRTTLKARTRPKSGDAEDLLDASGLPIPSFSDVFAGLGGIFGTLLGGGASSKQPARIGGKSGNHDDLLPSGPRLGSSGGQLKTNNGKIDWSDPRTQAHVAKLMSDAGQNPTSQEQMRKFMQQHPGAMNGMNGMNGMKGMNGMRQQGNANSNKFNFDNPNEQVQFVKFLQTFDQYQPQPKGPNPLFPRPPPISGGAKTPQPPPPQQMAQPPPTEASQTPPPQRQPGTVPQNSIAVAADSLSPEVWDLINRMQKPGYYNVTKEQMAILQPILTQMKLNMAANNAATSAPEIPIPPPQTPPPQPPPPPSPQQFQGQPTPNMFAVLGQGGGDPLTPFGSMPPVPPLLPQPLPTDPPTVPTTTTTTTAAPVPITLQPALEIKMLNPIPEGSVQMTSNAAVKPPSQPPFRDVVQKHDCATNCQADDPNMACDTRIGACMCRPGYHSSFLEGNVCTKTIFSLCSMDEDCQSGGDMNTVCAFNGANRFCTCSNGYLPDTEGTCRPMFGERCSGVCNIPNAVCDQFQGICRCPTGYAWFKDPWSGQPVCRAALGGAVPCRSDQDLCPIYTPRGKCRNNAFCGCEEGYIPDSWFTNQSERTSCIDVLSAKCDDSSDCTVADRNTICDRRLRMCVCKAGYKPDPFHNAACIAAS